MSLRLPPADTPAKKALRALAWSLIALAAAALLLLATWLLLNRRDVPAEPWPAALSLPANTLADADNLLRALQNAPPARTALNPCRPDGDCQSGWRERLPAHAQQRATDAAFGRACEAASLNGPARFEDPLPAEWKPDTAFPSLLSLSRCHGWWAGRALEALSAGQDADALHALRAADRLDRAAQHGARSLTAQMVAAGLWGRKLQLLQLAATERPDLAAALRPLAQLDAHALLQRQRLWVRVESQFQRTSLDALRRLPCEGRDGDPGRTAPWICHLYATGWQPEYAIQRMGHRWLRVLDRLAAAPGLPEALPGLRALLVDEKPSAWEWFSHTTALVLDEVARPALLSYFNRQADLQLAAEATERWLAAPAGADWAVQASPALRQRLQPAAGGGWQLSPHDASSRSRLPLAWTAARGQP